MTIKLRDNAGRELDAEVEVGADEHGWAITFESEGGATGGRPPRNTDYAEAVGLVLARLAAADARIVDIEVASRPALKKPKSERQVWPDGFGFPLRLSTVESLRDLQLAIGRKVGEIGRPHNAKGGNRRKRLRISLSNFDGADFPIETLVDLVVLGNLPGEVGSDEEPTSDHEELLERVARIRSRRKSGKGWRSGSKGNREPEAVPVQTTRYIRDPYVVADALDRAEGDCEVCGRAAPFLRSDGSGYLEVHHVIPLAEGGPDILSNVVACCANCHRELHYGLRAGELRKHLLLKVAKHVSR